LLITGPVNTNKGKIDGAEAQIRTFFDWDWMPAWARSFGIEANATYIDARAQFNILADPAHQVPGLFIDAPLTDVSKWTYNLTGMYEHGPLSLRLSWSHRTSYPEGGFANNGNFTLQGLAHPSSRLDLSANYNLSSNLTFFANWTNILPHPFHSDIVRRNYDVGAGTLTSTEIFPMVVRFEETVLSGGVRFNFDRQSHAVSAPAYVPLPPPPPPAAPVVEQPAPPPPPTVTAPERGN
jgi:iron complex outermembrane receptor protein